METVEALHAYFCLLLACGVLSLTVSAPVQPGARQDVMGQYRLTNRQQNHRLCWYRALCGSYRYHTESSAPLMDVSTSPPNCVLHAQNDSENCLCSVCVLHTQHDGENCLCSSHTTWRWDCLYYSHTTWRWELSVFCANKMTVRNVCVLHTQHDGDNCLFCTQKMADMIHCDLRTENISINPLYSAHISWYSETFVFCHKNYGHNCVIAHIIMGIYFWVLYKK